MVPNVSIIQSFCLVQYTTDQFTIYNVQKCRFSGPVSPCSTGPFSRPLVPLVIPSETGTDKLTQGPNQTGIMRLRKIVLDSNCDG